MNICVFTRTLLTGGSEKQSVLLANTLAVEHCVYLIVLHKSGVNNYKDIVDRNNVTVYFLKGHLLSKAIQLIGIFKRKDVDIVFSYLLSTNMLAAFAGKISKVKFIIGGIRNTVHPRIKEFLLKFIHNNLTYKTISNTYSSIKILGDRNFNIKKLYIIPNGIDTSRDFIKRKEKETIQILTVSRFVKQKDYFTALKAINYLVQKALKDTNYRIIYNIIGYGSLEVEIRNFIKNNNLSKVVRLFKNIEKENLLFNSDIYLSTSLYEGTSNSILEAMDYSLPIVATDVGDNYRLINSNRNGYLCEIQNSDQISECLLRLIMDYDLRIKMGKESNRIINERYSLHTFKQNYCKFINSLSNESNNKLFASVDTSVQNKLEGSLSAKK